MKFRPKLRWAAVVFGTRINRREAVMPQMFDWIFFAIVILPMVFLLWDWYRNK